MPEFEMKKVRTVEYDKPTVDRGYTDHFLSVDVSTSHVSIDTIPGFIKDLFLGGRGYEMWLLWGSVKGYLDPGGPTRWSDPENAICFASGPLGGTPGYPGAGKGTVVAISPLTGVVIDSNVGGYFHPFLKFSGFDTLKVVGKSGKDVVIYIDSIDGKIEIFHVEGLPDEANEITEILTEHFAQGKPRNISVVSAGTAAKHVRYGCLNVSFYDAKRKRARLKQAGRGGTGTVFAHKGIKAIVCRCDSPKITTNNPYDEEALKKVISDYSNEIRKLDPKQMQMARTGTTILVGYMNDPKHDILPNNNFQFGHHPDAVNLTADVYKDIFHEGRDGCWKGCKLACAHCVEGFMPLTGPYQDQQVGVDGPEYESLAAVCPNLGIYDPLFAVEMNFYCDIYGIDTISFGVSVGFAMDCFDKGLITEEHTDGLDLSFGNKASALELLHQMARGEGFGRIVGQGVRYMKKFFAATYGVEPGFLKDIGMETKGLEFSLYISKESLAQQGAYGLANKGPQHDEGWLIFEDKVRNNMPTFDDKAYALKFFPNLRTLFGVLGLCKLPWNDVTPEDNEDYPQTPLREYNVRSKFPKHLDWLTDCFYAVTGQKLSRDELLLKSEAILVFQRLFNLKMGFGRREHDRIPYRAMGPATVEEYESRQERYDEQLSTEFGTEIEGKTTYRKMALLRVFREEQYEKLLDAVYKERRYTNDGIPTLALVRDLGLLDIPGIGEDLKRLLWAHKVKE